MGFAVAVAIVFGAGVPRVFALGFRNPDQGAAATAEGNAFVAQADDATAIYYNPAGLTQFHGTEDYSGGEFAFPDNKLKGAGSGAEMSKWSMIPHLYISSDFGLTNSPWRFGVGVNVPFGNQSIYSQNGPFKYAVTRDSLQVWNIQPTVAFKFNEHLSLGAGLNVYDAYTALNNHVANPIPGGADGHSHYDASGVALGATAGVLWKITPQHSVGVVYRSPFTVDFSGTADVNIPPVVNHAANGGQASLPFPQIVAAGYAFRPIPKLKLEADIDWTDWQPLHNLVLHSSGPANGEKIQFNWMDSFLYEFGAQYDLTENWKLRGGFIYSEETVPNSTFSPSIPDSTRYVLNVGVGYAKGRFSIDVLYQHTFSDDRTVNNTANDGAANGTWEITGNAIMVTSGLKL
jgi:long-chain fatty acid transport protein